MPGGFWVTERERERERGSGCDSSVSGEGAVSCEQVCDGTPHQLGLDEVTHHLVVEVIDGGPADPLLDVLFLSHRKRITLGDP